MKIDGKLVDLHASRKSLLLTTAQLGSRWDGVVKDLKVAAAPSTADLPGMIEWAHLHCKQASMVSDLFLTHPDAAFENNRLGGVLMLGSEPEFRSALYRYYLENYSSIPKRMVCSGYSTYEDSIEPDEWDGSVISQFQAFRVNPFLREVFLEGEILVDLDSSQVKHLLDRLLDSAFGSRALCRSHAPNLIALLSTPALQYRPSAIVSFASNHWNELERIGAIQPGTAAVNTAMTMRTVITRTSSFHLYEEISNNHPVISSQFPVHIELMIIRNMASDVDVRQNDNQDFPTFTLARAIGKSITTKKTQAWMIEWLSQREKSPDGIDCFDEKLIYDEIYPLLTEHRKTLSAKPSEFNPELVRPNEIMCDITSGRYFRVACRAFVSDQYRKSLLGIPLAALAISEQGFTEFFAPMFGEFFCTLPGCTIVKSLADSLSEPKHFDFLARLFSQALTPEVLFQTFSHCQSQDEIVVMTGLFEKAGLEIDSQKILASTGASSKIIDGFMSRDLGL